MIYSLLLTRRLHPRPAGLGCFRIALPGASPAPDRKETMQTTNFCSIQECVGSFSKNARPELEPLQCDEAIHAAIFFCVVHFGQAIAFFGSASEDLFRHFSDWSEF